MKRILFSLTILLLVSGCTDDLLFSSPSLQGKLNNNFVWRASAFSATVVSDTINIKGYNGNNSLQIMIPATSIGNYGLSSSSFASVSFMQDGLTYSTLNNGSSGLGQLSDGLIELIEYNAEERYVSGEFWFTAYSSNGDYSANFTIGRIFKVPIATPIP